MKAKALVDHYPNIYKSSEFESDPLSYFSHEHDSPILLDEIEKAMTTLKENKSPLAWTWIDDLVIRIYKREEPKPDPANCPPISSLNATGKLYASYLVP